MTSIWDSSLIKNLVPHQFQLTLGEGNTSLNEIEGIWYKREDLHPTGSVKDRGISFQISWLYSQGIKEAVISSSGNAAISAASYAKLADMKITAFLPQNADKTKVETLKELGCKIYMVSNSLKHAGQFAKENNAYWIRPSVNEQGELGYMTLGEELGDHNFDWLVFPVSSGTTVVGVYEGLKLQSAQIPRLLVVQTSSVNSISKEFDPEFTPEESSLATGIVSNVSPRRNQVFNLIKQTSGTAYTVDNEQIKKAYEYLHHNKIHASYEAAAGLAGWWKFENDDSSISKFKTSIIITGKDRKHPNE